ncbi:hypothetical protein [Novipirellula sp.]
MSFSCSGAAQAARLNLNVLLAATGRLAPYRYPADDIEQTPLTILWNA